MKKHGLSKLTALLLVVCLLTTMALAAGGQEKAERLMFRWCQWDDQTQSNIPNVDSPAELFGSINFVPGRNYVVALYAGNTDQLAEGMLNSENPEILEVQKEKGTGIYTLKCKTFGTVNLTYHHDSQNLTESISVTLPGWGGFYGERSRTEATYLPKLLYDKTNGTTVWCMAENGFSEQETAQLQIILDRNSITGTAQRVEIAHTDPVRYDIKVTLPAGQSIREWEYLSLKNGEMYLADAPVEAKVEPGLLIQRFGGPWGQMTEIGNPIPFDMMEKTLNGAMHFRLSYKTADDCIALDPEKLEITSSNEAVVKITKQNDCGKDQKPCFFMEFCSVGTAEVTLHYGEKTYVVEAEVTLPESILASEPIYAEKVTLPSNGFSVFEYPIVWAVCRDGYTAEEANGAAITTSNGTKLHAEPVRRENQQDRYDLKIALDGTAAMDGYSLTVRVPEHKTIGAWVMGQSNGKNAKIGAYEVGYCLVGTDMPFDINNEISIGGDPIEPGPAVYTLANELRAAAGIRKEDGQGYRYEEDTAGNVQIQVNRIWLSEFTGDPETFSLSGKTYVNELTGDRLPEQVSVYMRGDLEGGAKINMDLTLTLGQETIEHAVISKNMRQQFVQQQMYRRPDNDTVEKLNTFLADETNFTDQKTIYRIELGNTTYKGEIKLPDDLKGSTWKIEFIGKEQGGTKVTGSMNLNGTVISRLENIHFQSPKEQQGRAVFNGVILGIKNCSFQGYEVALDATRGSLALEEGNVFYNNKIAVRYDIEQMLNGSRNTAKHNLFLKNEIALQVLSMDEWLSPYYFRFEDCNFIDNDTDFDIRYNGNFYFYRNYYGELDDDEIEYRRPRVKHSAEGFVMTNPRWWLPVMDWSKYNLPEAVETLLEKVLIGKLQEPENKLVCDWEDDTVILNDEAGNLLIDPSAFDAQNQKTVDVFNQEEQSIGTWKFH